MHNKVVYHAMKTLHSFGFPVLRFNFRGAGLSEGEHDQGRGEVDDVRAALDWLNSEFHLPIVFCGFSFGAATGLRAACGDERVAGLISLGTPVAAAGRSYMYSFLNGCSKPKLFVSGSRDQYSPREELVHLVEIAPEPKELEIIEDAPDVDTLVVAIGGGGLISGVALAAKALKPNIKIIGVEPVGAPTLHESIAAGRLVELASLDTAAVTLAPRRSEDLNLAIIREAVERIVLVGDEEMRAAARWLWREAGIATELSGAASVAALLTSRYRRAAGERVCAIVCGAGSDGFEQVPSAGTGAG